MIFELTLISSALASAPTATPKASPQPAPMLIELEGQGLPRLTENDCISAGKAIAEKLKKKSFQSITTKCAHTSDDAGEFVPTIQARHANGFNIDQGIGSRRGDLETCKKDLKQLSVSVSSDLMLEQECIASKEYSEKGDAKPFWQAWITKLVPVNP